MAGLRAWKDLLHDAIDATASLVGEGHDSVQRTVQRVVSPFPVLAEPVGAVAAGVGLGTRVVLGSVSGVNLAVERITDAVLDRLGVSDAAPEPVPMRADLFAERAWAADQLLALINGAVGDQLAARQSPLDLGLRLRHGPAAGGGFVEGGVVGDVRADLVVFLHGLMATEWCWALGVDADGAPPDATFGARLEAELGVSALYVRYNTGRAMSHNAAAFSDAMERLVAGWPVPVRSILLVGHSMGGLVARMALRIGAAWTEKVEEVVCLGSPHDGAPLAWAGGVLTGVMGAVDTPATAVIGKLLQAQSAGMRDLQHGIGEVERDGRRWTLVAGTVTEDAGALTARAVGDGMVRVESALAGDGAARIVLPGVSHVALTSHQRAYRVVREAAKRGMEAARA